MTNEELVQSIKENNDPELILDLWNNNQGLIDKIVKKYAGVVEDREDLTQEAFIGFNQAVQRYDSKAGVLFSTYAYKVISTHLRRYIYDCCHLIKIPEVMATKIWKYKKFVEEFRKETGRTPTDREVWLELGIDPEEAERLRGYDLVSQPTSLDQRIQGVEEDGDTLTDMIRDTDTDIEATIGNTLDYCSISKELWEAVEQLPQEQRQAVKLKYIEGKTEKEIGQLLNVSKSQARQLHIVAERRLSKNKTLKDYKECYLRANTTLHVGVSQFKRTWTSEVELLAIRHTLAERNRILRSMAGLPGQRWNHGRVGKEKNIHKEIKTGENFLSR